MLKALNEMDKDLFLKPKERVVVCSYCLKLLAIVYVLKCMLPRTLGGCIFHT
jgi:hypothetical protein